MVGIVGYNYGVINSCYNLGKISGYRNIGGICGVNHGATISNCYNRGTVSSNGYKSSSQKYSFTGGISGNQGINATIKGCYNTGNVTASYAQVGGIVGYNGTDGTQTVKNVYNTGIIKKGSVSATTYIGVSANYVGYLIGRYQSLTGKYGNTTQSAMSLWTIEEITTNLSEEYTNDIQNEDGTWKYNDGYPVLKWQIEE